MVFGLVSCYSMVLSGNLFPVQWYFPVEHITRDCDSTSYICNVAFNLLWEVETIRESRSILCKQHTLYQLTPSNNQGTECYAWSTLPNEQGTEWCAWPRPLHLTNDQGTFHFIPMQNSFFENTKRTNQQHKSLSTICYYITNNIHFTYITKSPMIYTEHLTKIHRLLNMRPRKPTNSYLRYLCGINTKHQY